MYTIIGFQLQLKITDHLAHCFIHTHYVIIKYIFVKRSIGMRFKSVYLYFFNFKK